MDRRITIIQPIYAQGTSQESKITGWERISSIPDIWAEKIETRGNTTVVADRVVFSQTVTWKIRYRTDLNVSMRIVDEYSKVYSILGTQEENKGRKNFLLVTSNLLDNEYWT